MQAIDVYILNPIFLTFFFGTAVLSCMDSVTTIILLPRLEAPLLLAGTTLYLVGTVGVT